MTTRKAGTATRSINRHLNIALAAAVTLIFGAGGWAATTEISGAVLASGIVVVEANVKKVQHQTGGIVGSINVRNGQRVKQGDVLLRLDPTIAAANLAVVTKGLDAVAIKQLRLEAERDGRDAILLPADLATRRGEPELASLIRSETAFFESRRQARNGLRAQLGERIAQFEEQVEGLHLQVEAHTDSIDLIHEELTGLEDLYAKKLVPIARLMQLKRESAELRGKKAQALAEIAQSRGRIAEARLQILQIDEELRADVSGALSELQEKASELAERKVAAADQLQRIDLRAPVSGIVHELAVHTVGGVIDASAILMLIVPESDELTIEARVDVQDRDQIHVGQSTVLRMTSFNQKTTPELQGEVQIIGADLVEDVRTGAHYYPVRIRLLSGEKLRLGDKVLMPGMPVETFVQTGYRTVLSYLVKPLSDYLTKAFRSD